MTVEQATAVVVAFAGVVVAVSFLARLFFEKRRLRSLEKQWKAASQKIGHRVIVLNDCTCCPVHGHKGMPPAAKRDSNPSVTNEETPL